MKIDLTIPKPHIGQQKVISNARRFNVVCCGRRFGKTTLGQILAIQALLQGKKVGWFAPTYKFSSEVWRFFASTLSPACSSINKAESRLQLVTGGTLDVWSVDNPDSGRGRKYGMIVVDEAGIVRDLEQVWTGTLRPTLTDFKGDAWFLGTPKGRGYFHRLFAKHEHGDKDWMSWRLPTANNPLMPMEEIEAARADLPPEVFAQEYEGVPADDGGNPFSIKSIAECIGSLSTRRPVVWGIDLAKSHDYTVAVGLDDDGNVACLERWQGPWLSTQKRLASMIGNDLSIQLVWVTQLLKHCSKHARTCRDLTLLAEVNNRSWKVWLLLFNLRRLCFLMVGSVQSLNPSSSHTPGQEYDTRLLLDHTTMAFVR